MLKKVKSLTRTNEDTIVDIIVYIILGITIIASLYPFINILAISLNDPMDTYRGGITIFPRIFTTQNYKQVMDLSDGQLYHAALISILRTVTGTVTSVFCTLILAYILSKKDLFLKKFFIVTIVMTMYMFGGIIPEYIVIQKLGLINKFPVYILPQMLVPFYIFIVRTYIQDLPDSLRESARIDGAGEFTVLFKIIAPLAMPVIATVALFVAVAQWNSWFDTFLYAPSKKELSTLQYELMKKLASSMQNLGNSRARLQGNRSSNQLTPLAVQATMTVIVTLPIVCFYPFLQKYFVKGLTLGGVKE